MPPRIVTVTGPVPPERVNFTLPHEHTGLHLWQNANRWDRWELTPDQELITDELRDFRRRGGSCLVDLTTPGVGRDPQRLRRLATATNLYVVMGTAWHGEAHYPPEARIDRRTVDELADEIVREFRDGVADSGVRPGIIGEIGSDRPWVSAQEERVLRAAARASMETGMAISTHAAAANVGLWQLRIFEEEGADLSRVIIGGGDANLDLDYHLAVLDRGANVEFDALGHRFASEEAAEPRVIELLVELLDRGHGSQLLLSQDVCHNANLKANGGFGYTYLQQHFLPSLRTAAVAEREITQMTTENPRRLLSIA